MSLELKRIALDAVPLALAKAEKYRLLNEPGGAESICLDILAVAPGQQEALVCLLLSLTDQFDDALEARVKEAKAILPRLKDEYARTYYAGIIAERRARAAIRQNLPGGSSSAYESLVAAMTAFAEAEKIRPAGNDDALLRWNACARVLNKNPKLQPASDERFEGLLE